MAENEYLDSTKARRWQAVVKAVIEQATSEEIAQRIEDCFCKTLRQIRRDIPLGDLIRSLDDPKMLGKLCTTIHGAHDVKYCMIDASHRELPFAEKVESFVRQTLECCLHDVPYLVTKLNSEISISNARNTVESAMSHLDSQVDRITQKLSDNPDWCPRRSFRGVEQSKAIDTTEAMLGESLL